MRIPSTRTPLLLMALALPVFPVAALAQDAPAEEAAPPAEDPPPPEEDAATLGSSATVTQVMEWVTKAKWKELKTRIHPLTIKAMEERKKRTKRDDHGLSFWSHVKEWKIQKWHITNVEAGPRGSAVITTKEDVFMVEEKGVEEGREAQWLLVKTSVDGKPAAWWLLDRRNGTGNFTPTAIEKGFGDALPAEAEAPTGKVVSPLEGYSHKLEGAVRAKLVVPEDIPENQRKVMHCIVKLMLDEGGGVLSRTVDKASGNPAFDKAVIRAVDAAQPLPAPENSLVEDARKGVLVTFKAKP